jgi:hypothetical protein
MILVTLMMEAIRSLKLRSLQGPHGVAFQMTAFFKNITPSKVFPVHFKEKEDLGDTGKMTGPNLKSRKRP